MRRLVLPLIIGLTMSASVIQAHHSIAGVYDNSRKVTLDGVIAQFNFVNPHPFALMDVKNAGGMIEHWKLEMDNKNELNDVGITRDTLKSGDRVIVSGSPARDGALGMYVLRLDRPADGFLYEQVGNSPRVTFGPK